MPRLRSVLCTLVAGAALAAVGPGTATADIGQSELFRSPVPAEAEFAPRAEGSARVPEPPLEAVPRAVCGPGARQETGIQGRISRADHTSGLAAKGLRCNAELVGQHTQEKAGQDGTIVGTVGGYKVLRYVDKLGNECAFYDTSLLPPSNVGDGNVGVRVLDMKDPTKPALTSMLTTPAMVSPHESLILSEKRGLLMAVAGTLGTRVLPGQVDIYDLNATPGQGCKVPLLMSSTPLGIYGHESGLAPDGNTFYASSLSDETVTALDISNPVLPKLLVHQTDVAAHGLTFSADGNTAYVARGQNSNGFEIYDVSSIQKRTADPKMVKVSKLTWNQMSVPQNTIPITIGGKPFVIESDEFQRNGTDRTGASRIIDISDPKEPYVISNLRLEVHQEANRIGGKLQDDPGTSANGTNPVSFAQDYTGHFCNVPTLVDPKIVACGMSISGLRVFNIEDPYNPREVAYFTAPVQPRAAIEGSNWAYSQPTFAPDRKEIWYTEAYTGFYAVKLTNDAWPDAKLTPPDPGPTTTTGTTTTTETTTTPAPSTDSPTATTGSNPSATAPGGTTGAREPDPIGASRCEAPTSTFGRGTRLRRSGVRLRGAATPGAGCKLAAVSVAIGRKVGKQCRFMRSSGRFGKKVNCRRTTYVKARGTTRWSFDKTLRLPRGSYNVWSRAINTAGTRERKSAKRNLTRLTVR